MTITSTKRIALPDGFEGTGFLQLNNREPGPYALLTASDDGEGLKIATKTGAFLVNLKTLTVTTEGTPDFEEVTKAFRTALNYVPKP